MLRLGAPIFDAPSDPLELARAHVQAGYTSAYCPQVDLADAQGLRATREAFLQADVLLAEVGAWCNLLAPDSQVRARNIAYACQQLTLADELGACCAVDYLGTFDPGSDFGPHQKNLTEAGFEAAVEVVRHIIDSVRPRRTVFALEMMQWIIPDTVEIYERLLAAVDRKQFGVHVDPVNLILTPRQYYDTAALLKHVFSRLGSRIASCHAKDIRLRNELALHFDEVPPGKGLLDYQTYLAEIRSLEHLCGRAIPLMLEHLPDPPSYQAAAQHIRSQYALLP
jgi:sugar phosphate isomerase/epimerase